VAECLVSEVTAVTQDTNNSPTSPYSPTNAYDIYLTQCMNQGIDPYSNNHLFPTLFNPMEGSDTFGSNSRYSSSTNLSMMSSGSHQNSPLPSPSKSLSYGQVHSKFSKAFNKSGGMTKSSSFSSSLLNNLTGTHNQAHSYSLANFDLCTDLVDGEVDGGQQHDKSGLTSNLKLKS